MVLRNAVFLVLKTNARFLKDISNNSFEFPLLNRKKKRVDYTPLISAFNERPTSLMVFPVCPWACLQLPSLGTALGSCGKVHPPSELAQVTQSCWGAACWQNLAGSKIKRKKSLQCGTMLP